jgi:membrane protein implicated in regulation of membrane protease activity
MAEERHPGITMHRLSFGGGLMGLLFAAGSALIFIFGLPALWYFVAFALALGLGIALFLRKASDRLSQRNKPMSLFAVSEQKTAVSEPSKTRLRWHRLPRVAAA